MDDFHHCCCNVLSNASLLPFGLQFKIKFTFLNSFFKKIIFRY